MNIQKISHTNLNSNLKIQKNNQNATPVFQNQMDSFVRTSAKNISFKGNTLDELKYGTEARFYVQYARNLMDDVRDIRVDGYNVVESIKEIEEETAVTKIQAKRIYDDVMNSFDQAKKAGYTTVKGDKDSRFATRVFHRNLANGIIMEDYDDKNKILRRSILDDDTLIIKDYELDDKEYALYQFDIATDTLRRFGQDVKETRKGFEAEEYLLFGEDGNLEMYAIDTITNADGSGKSDFVFNFLDPVNLIIYSQDQTIDSNGTEKSKVEYNFARTTRASNDEIKQRLEVLSCNLDSVYSLDGSKKASRVFSYSLENCGITEYKKNFVADAQGNKSSALTMKFDENECLSEVLTKSSESDNGEVKAERLIYYRDEEPAFTYVDYSESESGEEDYKKMHQFKVK